MMKNILSPLVLCTTLLSGCASQHQYLKMHDDVLPPGQVPALVKPVAFVNIHASDGKKFSISPSSGMTTEYELEFLPGVHLLEVSYDSGSRVSRGSPLPFQIRLESGRRYIIKPRVIELRWRPVLIDVTDRPQCWTISVGTSIGAMPLGPKGCDELEQ